MPEKIGLEATLEMGAFNKGLKRYTGGIQKMSKLTATITGKMGRALVGVGKFVGKTMVAGIAVGATAIAALGAGMTKLAIDAAPLQGIKAAFEGITEASGVAADEMLAALKKSSAGMLTNKAAMETYNLAAMLVGDTFANELPNAMGYLTKVSAATGESMDFMMGSLVKGIGRLSPMILDNLGIQVNLTEAYEDYAAQMGINVDEMTKSEQQTALMNQTMMLLQKNTAAMPEVTGTAAAAMGSLKAQLQDTKDTIGLALLPTFTKIMGAVSTFAKENLPKLVTVFEQRVIPAISQLVEKVGWIIDAFRDAGIVSSEFEEALSSIVGEEVARFIVDMADAISQLIQKIGWVIDAFRDAGIVSSEFEEALSSIVGEEIARGIVDFADAVRGAIAWVTEAIGEFQRGFAWAVSEGMDPFTAAMTGVAEILDDFLGEEVMDKIWNFVDGMEKVVAFIEENLTPILAGFAAMIAAVVVPALASIVAGAVAAIPAAIATAVAMAPIILAIAAIGLAVGLLVKAWQTDWKGIRTTLTKFWYETAKPIFELLKVWFTTTLPAALVTIRDWFVKTWDKITTAVTDAWKRLVMIFDKVKQVFTIVIPEVLAFAWETIKRTVRDAIEAVLNKIKETLVTIKLAWQTAWDAVGDFLQKAWDTIRLIFVTALILFLDIFGIKLEDVIEKWRTTWDAVSAWLTKTWEIIKTTVSTAATAVYEYLKTKLTETLEKWSMIWDMVKAKIGAIWDAIKQIVRYAIIKVYRYIEDKIDQIKESWGIVWDAVSDKVSGIWETIKSAVDDAITAVLNSLLEKYLDIKAAILDPLSDAWQGIMDTLGDWLQIGKDILQGLIDGAKAMAQKLINSVVGAIEGAIARAKALLGIGSASLVFIEIGHDLMEGFIQGIRERMAEMFRDAEDIRDELAEIFDMADVFARIGRGAMSAFRRWTVDPLEEELERIEAQLAELEELDVLTWQAQAYQIGLWRERERVTTEIADAEERILALQEQQAKVGFLETQLKLLDLIESRGLDPAEILGGAALGIAADPGAIMDAMTRAMTAVVERAQYELTIEAMGGQVSAPALFQQPGMLMPTSTTSTVNVSMGGVNIYDQMSWAVFEANVRQIMASSVGG